MKHFLSYVKNIKEVLNQLCKSLQSKGGKDYKKIKVTILWHLLIAYVLRGFRNEVFVLEMHPIKRKFNNDKVIPYKESKVTIPFPYEHELEQFVEDCGMTVVDEDIRSDFVVHKEQNGYDKSYGICKYEVKIIDGRSIYYIKQKMT